MDGSLAATQIDDYYGVSQTQQAETPIRNDKEAVALWGRLISKSTADQSVYDLRHRPSSSDSVAAGEDNEYSIGRHESCDIRIDDNRVSKKHCRLYTSYSRGRLKVFLQDMSVNGTQLNQLPRLHKGDVIELSSGDEIHLTRSSSFIFINVSEQVASMRSVSMHASMLGVVDRANVSRRVEDEYIIGSLLGEGQCGKVYLCVRKTTKDKYAVKIIDASRFAPNPGLTAAELRGEAEILSGLDHPRIIKIVDTYENEGMLFIVMELVAGGDLFDRVNLRQRYSDENARVVMSNILSAVSYLHANGIVHRDLKPENILLVSADSDTDVKITDFGLAKKANQEGLKTFCGTPQYFAPEVLKRRNTFFGAGRYGASADMWSVGVTLYILLSGTYPFAEERLFTQLESAAYSFAGPEWRHASDAAKDLVARLMELKPERRLSAEAALKHPWIAGSHFSGQVLPSGKLRSTSFDSSPRPQVHQLSWGRPAWLGGGSKDKDVLSISDALPLLSISDGSAPKTIYKSAATAKMQIAASKELPHDAITDFDSPDRHQYVLGKKRDSALQVVEGSAAKRLKIEASDMENNAPNSAVVGKSKPPRQVKKGSKSSLKPDSSRGSQMSIMDAFRGHKR